jgi:hypothetical protein
VVAVDALGLMVVDFGSIIALATDVHVCFAVNSNPS